MNDSSQPQAMCDGRTEDDRRMRASVAVCDLCGGSGFETVSERDRQRRPLQTVVCRRCGLVSHATIPTDQELEDYYRDQYRQEYNSEFTPSAERVLREWVRGAGLFNMLRGHIEPSDHVFEIGCGIGCNLAHFQLAGHPTSGVEPGDGFRRFARQELHLNVAGGMLADVPREPRYDFVLLPHVLEHLRSPATALRHIHAMLKSGGRLYIEVPNLAAPHAAPRKLFHYAHIYNFTPTTLASLAAVCGFHVHTVFSRPREKNLMVILSLAKDGERRWSDDGYVDSLTAVRRYNTLTYHLRWTYLRERFTSLRYMRAGKVDSETQVAEILERCALHAKAAGRGVAQGHAA